MSGDRLAFDRASVRRIDQDGRMYVEVCAISKAAVNEYLGSEIPDSERLGLRADGRYRLLRDPTELARAAATFNNLPLLSVHVPVTAADPQKELIVGATGTDAVFEAPYLLNSLVVWDAVAIAGIELDVQRELSSAYHYEADMTPGTYDGQAYDGVMRNIRGNHVALVEKGRAGPDVVVGDSNLSELSMKKPSRKALVVMGALKAYLRPRLAQDAQIGDLSTVVGDVTTQTFAQRKAAIAEAVQKRFGAKLAADANLEDLPVLLDAFTPNEAAEEEAAPAKDTGTDPADIGMDDKVGKVLALLEGKLSSEDLAAIKAVLAGEGATDEDPEPPEGGAKKPAMDAAAIKLATDAAIAKAVTAARAETIASLNAIREAERIVAPLIGEVAAQQSAADVYKLALDAANVDLTDVPPQAYRAMVLMLPKPGASAVKTLAQDSSAISDFQKQFPGAVLPGRS